MTTNTPPDKGRMDGISFKSNGKIPDWTTLANESFSLFESNQQIRSYAREAFLQNGLQYRKLESALANTRLRLEELSRKVPARSTVTLTPDLYITKDAVNTADVTTNVEQFLNTRSALKDRYAPLLESVASGLTDLPQLRDNQIATVADFDFYARKLLCQFAPAQIISMFSAAASGLNRTTFVPVIGPYVLLVDGEATLDIQCTDFYQRIAHTSVDIYRSEGEISCPSEIPIASHDELLTCLTIAERLASELQTEAVYQRYDRIVTNAALFESQTERRHSLFTAMYQPDHVKRDGLAALADQKRIAQCLTRWAAYPLLKIDNLSVHVAMQLVNFCNLHIQSYR